MTDSMWRIVRYGIVGASGALLQIVALWVWVSVLDMREYYLAGVWIGFCLALALTFPLQKFWTFKDTTPRTRRQFFSYTVIALCTLTANTLLLSLAKTVLESMQVDFFRMWYLIADAGIVGVIALISFLLNRGFTFRAVSEETAQSDA